MAKTVGNEELQFRKKARRRLIGAVALVLVAVVALPMVLDREPKPVSQSVDIRIPSKDNAPDLPLQAAPVPAPLAAPAAPAAQNKEAAESAMAKPADPPAAPPAPKTEAAKKPEAVATVEPRPKAAGEPRSVPPGDGFVVQLGAFSSAANAKQQQDKLSANGFKSYTEAVKTAQGTQTRVRAGPYPTREAAEKAREQLKRLGIDGMVTTK